ncbi:anti-anti-sigma factor [Allocatelliglobosispora scoriae]|uniref:Anti-anti-sigma factor n=1 Tax=Allocatelliglobosispora scoriae TaxID=643052 RepID=A0A841BK91_9ACTN|nr:anti-anti-sigma factor [Allocatelliglobosispora scoriae]
MPSTPTLTHTLTRDGSAQTLGIHGMVDFSNADALSRWLNSAVSTECTSLVLDLRHLDFIDSSGARSLIEGHRLAATHGVWIKAVGASPIVLRTLSLLGVTDLFDIAPL